MGAILEAKIPFYTPSLVSMGLFVLYIISAYMGGMPSKWASVPIMGMHYTAVMPLVVFICAINLDVVIAFLSGILSVNTVLYAVKYQLFVFTVVTALKAGITIEKIFSPFAYICIFTFVTGSILFALYAFGFDLLANSFDVSFLRKAEEGNLGEYLYSWPFGLGLLITGQNMAFFLGLQFYQFCSFYIEPQVFCLNTIPVLIITTPFLWNLGIKGKMVLFGSVALILWAFSLTAMIALVAVVCVGIVFYRNSIWRGFALISLVFLCTGFLLNVSSESFEELVFSASLLQKIFSRSSSKVASAFSTLIILCRFNVIA